MWEALKDRWNTSETPVKAGMSVAAVLILALAVWAIVWATRTDYQVLFSELDPQDAAQMVAELEKSKIGYKLENEGTTILVDAEDVHRTRLKLMGKGMNLRGTVGFEVFNESDFGTSEFAQKVNFQRALQGELARTIMAFEEVKVARVHLVMPESGLFKKNRSKAKASVSLVTRSGTRLESEQIAGIQRLVAASVPEMEPSAVTIIDERGAALTSNVPDDPAVAGANGRIALKKDIEGYVGQKIAALLDGALGPGKAIVSVDVTLNYDQVRITREDVTPANNGGYGEAQGVVVRKRQSHTVSATSREIPRADGPSSVAAPREDTSPRSTTTDIEYQTGRRVEQIVSEPGAIRRVSVGVLLHGDISGERMDQIKDVVEMAAGISPERGDAVVVRSVSQLLATRSSATSDKDDAETPASGHAGGDTETVLRWLLIALGITFILAALILAVRKHRARGDRGPMSAAERERALNKLNEWLSADRQAAPEGTIR